jgi:hypothetical protein
MKLTIRKPDDWHLHVRDGAMLKAVMPFTAKHFGHAILMPNLVPPVMTTKDVGRISLLPRHRFRAASGGEAIVYRGGETIEWKVTS